MLCILWNKILKNENDIKWYNKQNSFWFVFGKLKCKRKFILNPPLNLILHTLLSFFIVHNKNYRIEPKMLFYLNLACHDITHIFFAYYHFILEWWRSQPHSYFFLFRQPIWVSDFVVSITKSWAYWILICSKFKMKCLLMDSSKILSWQMLIINFLINFSHIYKWLYLIPWKIALF